MAAQRRDRHVNDALLMKEQQVQILNEQNSQLLETIQQIEDDFSAVRLVSASVEHNNLDLRDANFQLDCQTRAAGSKLATLSSDNIAKDKQLRIVADQNSELLRLLEAEETTARKLTTDNLNLNAEMSIMKKKYDTLLTTAKVHENMAEHAMREGQLRARELQSVRLGMDIMKKQNRELQLKTQVEVESLRGQLRAYKDKLYRGLEKLQARDETASVAQDQVAALECQLRTLRAEGVALDTRLQNEIRNRHFEEISNRNLAADLSNLIEEMKEIRSQSGFAETERLRIELEARESSEQLREMAAKVFQLLERLKLAELGKSRAMEEVMVRDRDIAVLTRKNARLLREAAKEGKRRVKAEFDAKLLQEQLRSLRAHNAALATRCRNEVCQKLHEREEKTRMVARVRTVTGRLAFFLNKMQCDEEAKAASEHTLQELHAQLRSANERTGKLHQKAKNLQESNNTLSRALRVKQQGRDAVNINQTVVGIQSEHSNEGNPCFENLVKPRSALKCAEFAIAVARLHPHCVVLKGTNAEACAWLEAQDTNTMLRELQTHVKNTTESLVAYIGRCLGTIMAQEEKVLAAQTTLRVQGEQLTQALSRNASLQRSLSIEEDAKRRALLRYVHSVSELGPVSVRAAHEAVHGIVQLAESSIADEELAAIAAVLRGDRRIVEVCLRNNSITDDGIRALVPILSVQSSITRIDLRSNSISAQGITFIAESLEQAPNIAHVYVHESGKVEAFGCIQTVEPDMPACIAAPTDDQVRKSRCVSADPVCIVDCRGNG